METLIGLHSIGKLLALPANIRLGWKQIAVTNTLAYYDAATITAFKLSGVYLSAFHQVLPHITLRWKCLSVTNALAYQ